MMWYENIVSALSAIRGNWLRSFLTLMIIAFGIMALVGILTAIDTIIYSMGSNFSSLGANSFSIQPSYSEIQSSREGRIRKRGEPISFEQAMSFKSDFDMPVMTGVHFQCTGSAVVRYRNEKTNPTVSVIGADENYLDVTGEQIEYGRNFSPFEVESGSFRAVIGYEIVRLLFDEQPEKALNEVISVGNTRYKVIGVMEEKGSAMGGSTDRRIYIPLATAKRFYATNNTSYTLTVNVKVPEQLEEVVSSATGLMRNIRGLRAGVDNDFRINKSDGIIDMIKENTVMLRMATIAIGLMTLLGAAIGLMNIMLVSVTERTREIGILKAIGASSRSIMMQFLTEAVVICQLGGIVGVFLGILVGNIVTLLIGGEFLIPWAWILLGLVVCMVVGLVSGLYPAIKASRLDPIEALRYE